MYVKTFITAYHTYLRPQSILTILLGTEQTGVKISNSKVVLQWPLVTLVRPLSILQEKYLLTNTGQKVYDTPALKFPEFSFTFLNISAGLFLFPLGVVITATGSDSLSLKELKLILCYCCKPYMGDNLLTSEKTIDYLFITKASGVPNFVPGAFPI